MKKILIAIFILTTMLLAYGCGNSGNKVKLDTKNPVSLTVWHYYNGAQQAAFDEQVAEFNSTEGKEKGIYVTGYSQGDVASLEERVRAAIAQEVGSEPIPNIFSSYADMAYEIEKKGYLADIGQYLTADEIAEYVDSYIEEGRIGSNEELKIFPIAKSTEIMMINKTDWEQFAAATGASLEELKTKEGLVRVAQSYYEWTDQKTPEVAEDGKAFYGRDVMANMFIISSMQLGTEIFAVDNQQVTLNVDKDIMKRIWDCYYNPYIKGYFKSFGRFRSDDLKIGEIIAFTGSTASAMYFPNEVEKEETYPIDYQILPAPIFDGGEAYAIQQGAGMVITRSTPEEEYASALFLKWITGKEQNTAFVCESGYLPVRKSACDRVSLDTVIADRQLAVLPKTYDTITMLFDSMEDYQLYTNKAFDGGTAARKVLESHLQEKASADREQVVERLAAGMSLTEATADFLTEGAFEAWYQDFCQSLEAAVRGNG